jgi:hypothetical protein
MAFVARGSARGPLPGTDGCRDAASDELLGMTPSRPRSHVWPLAALPAAGLIALVVAASGLSQEKPYPTPRARAETLQPDGTFGPPVQATIRPASESNNRVDPPAPPESDRQISYEVRYITIDANPWRELIMDQLKPVKDDAAGCAWIIDHHSTFRMLKWAQENTTCNVLQPTFRTSHLRFLTISLRPLFRRG